MIITLWGRGLNWCWKRKEACEELIYRLGKEILECLTVSAVNGIAEFRCDERKFCLHDLPVLLASWRTRSFFSLTAWQTGPHRKHAWAYMLVLLQILCGSSRGPSLHSSLFNVIQTNPQRRVFLHKSPQNYFSNFQNFTKHHISVIFVSLRYSVLIFWISVYIFCCQFC